MSYYLLLYIICDISCVIFASILLRKVTLNLGDTFEVDWLRYLISSFIFFALTDMVWPFIRLQTATIPVWILRVLCSISEIALGLVGYVWFIYAEHRLRSRLLKDKKHSALFAIPFLSLCLLALLSIFTGWTYTINDDGSYTRGPFFLMQHAIIYFYVLTVTIQALVKYKGVKTNRDKNTCRSIILFASFPLVASIVQLFIQMTPILCLSIFAAILFIFINLMEGQIFTDALTGLNNRRQAERYFSSLVSQASGYNAFYLYMLDVDHFKSVNDSWGHIEGDVALGIVASSLKKITAQYRGFAARYGGDEFMLIIRALHIVDPKMVLQKLNVFLADECRDSQTCYDLTISGGWYQCSSKDESFLDAVEKADEMLYINKRSLA
ncbi:MAG: GGDEF domain-containing protein [Atopobium sp.]|nr:GGDEF domain-containing protein [Atopobium sp.]